MSAVTGPHLDASVVDLFCGVGGLSFGFKKEDFKVTAGVDIDEHCRFAYETNIGAAFLRKDVGSLTSKEIENLFVPGTKKVLVGCAPCQPFSTYNQKNEDPNWNLLYAFSDIISASKPDVVSMENVPRLLAFRGGAVFSSFVSRLRAEHYEVVWGVVYGPDFGLAQTRSRLVLLASRLGPISMPSATHTLNDHRTVRQEIGDLRPLKHGQSDGYDALHRASRLSPKNEKRIISSKPGGTWRDWDADLVADCHKVKTGKGYSSVYGRMVWSEPSPTITTQFYGFGNGRFGHPDQDRALSLREGALLQGFPLEYKFVEPGSKVNFKRVGRLIGNAVPVMLASAIARSVKLHLGNVQ